MIGFKQLRFLLIYALGVLSPIHGSYRIAYVEHVPIDPCSGGSCGERTRDANVRALIAHIQAASKKGVQIIVFPEYGISGEGNFRRSAWVSGGYTEEFGDPAGRRTVPCDEPESYSAAKSVVSLSCAAKANKVAVVANLAENVPVHSAMYNTNVAFDTDGAFLAKYRKQNLWGEW